MKPVWRKDGRGWKVVGEPTDLVEGAFVDSYLPGSSSNRKVLVGKVRPCQDDTGLVYTRVSSRPAGESKPLPRFEVEQKRKAKARDELKVVRANSRPRTGPCDECGRAAFLVDSGEYRVCRPCNWGAA